MADIAFAPALPFGVPILATLGDSRLAQGFTNGAGSLYKRPLGACWLEPMLQGRVRLPTAYNCAVTGAMTSDILATQLPVLMALNPKPTHCIVLCGTNDIGNSIAQGTIKANFLAIWGALRSAKIQAVQVCDLPRTNASWNTTDQQLSQELNEWMRYYGPKNGVAVVDPTPYIADPANGNGDPLTGYYQTDGIHPAPLGAYQINVALAQYFNTIPLPGQARPASLADAFNVTNNPRGNLLPNAGLFTGTAGVNLGTGASGTVATSWQNRVVSGTMTAVAIAPAARTDAGAAGNWQEIDIAVSAAGVYRLSPNVTITGQAVGDTVWGEIDVSWTGASKLLYCQLNVFDVGGASALGAIAFKDPGMAGLYMPASSGGTLRLITDPFLLTTGNTDVPMRLELGFDTGGACTLKVGGASLRKLIVQ